jgi:SNF2 family DNA or RNA helicase
LSQVYICRKCGRVHSRQEYDDNRFCRNCGSFLFSRKDVSTSSTRNIKRSPSERNVTELDLTKFLDEKTPTKVKMRTQVERTTHVAEETTSLIRESSQLISYSDPHNIRAFVFKGQFSPFEKLRLNLKAQEIKAIGAIDKLISMDVLRTKVDAHPFQMKVALTILQEMRTNGILADEVGLGKTIEAGIIMKELLLRGIIESVLIIVPRSLLTQWKVEMREKFGEKFVIANDPDEFFGFDADDKIICSSGLLLHRHKEIKSRKWDLLIVDEAHTYRNTKSKGRRHISEIPRNYLLLLTATPLCNKLTDLYSLIDLVYPGRLETESSFISRYAADSKCRIPRRDTIHELRNIVYEVMCRTRRIETNIPFTKRFPESRRVEASDLEYDFIEKATDYLRGIGNNRFKTVEQLKAENPTRIVSESQSRAILIFQAIALQQSLSSSPYAAIESLQKRYDSYPAEREIINELIKLAKQIKSSKLELIENVMEEVKGEQALIFCLRKATVRKIKEILEARFGKAEIFLGDMTTSEREKVIEEFKTGNIRYMVATDAAAEGLNLQQCNILFNYDLHWNPMKIEQRIGRIHRLGQERDVTIFNLSIKDTIDDYVLHILYQKLDLFLVTIGGMETILSQVKEGNEDIEKTIMEILLRSKKKLDLKEELEKLSKDIGYAREKHELADKFTKGVLG